MMSNPDQIRADIEVTRDELGRDVDALADKVSPPKIMERQKTRARQMMGGVTLSASASTSRTSSSCVTSMSARIWSG